MWKTTRGRRLPLPAESRWSLGSSWDANDRRDRHRSRAGAHGTTGSHRARRFVPGPVPYRGRGGSNSTGPRRRRGRDLHAAHDPDAALGARSVGVRLAGARLCGRRGSGRIVGYPSNAGRPVGRRIVCRARRGLRLYRQPHVQGEARHAGGHTPAARDGSTPRESQAMSSRLEALEARRLALLNKCEEQRLELAYRLAQIKPAEQLTAWTRRGAGSRAQSPITWIAGLVGLLLMLRRRRLLSGVGWIT